ncbi:MAG: cation:dicarboxylate symporter family transporter, partial [Turicibacter sp.]
FVSIIRVIINMQDSANLGRLTGKTLGTLIGTTAIAAVVGILVANFFKLGIGTNVMEGEVALKEITSVVDTLRGLIPANPVKAMADANVVAVVIFAAFLGIATKRQTKKYFDVVKPFIDLVEAFYKVILSVAMTVIKWMPYAVIALLANTIAGRGMAALYEVIDFIIALYVSVGIMFIIHLVIISINGYNPIKYVMNVLDALVLAFTSRSSLGTLPVTIETLTDKVGLDNGTATFVGSLGANGGMNGCAGIYPALVAVMLANMSGTTMDLSFYVMLVLVIALGSIGIAGLPGTATVAVSVVISGMGMGAYFPLAAGILAIDPILDMGRTMINVNGTLTAAMVVGHSENQISKDVFNRSK